MKTKTNVLNNKSNKIAACVILYYPSSNEIRNIDSYADKVDHVYILDNSELESNYNLPSNSTFYNDKSNKGISIRLNQACKKAILDGYDFLLTMDQDSSFDNEIIDTYFNYIKNYPNTDNTAVFGLDYDFNNMLSKKDIPFYSKESHLITSASVINLKHFEIIGGFDEALFIDGVDIDYCWSAILKGLDIIKINNLYFKHSIGEETLNASYKSLYLIKKRKRIHGPLRIYYMKRNCLYLEEKYKIHFPQYVVDQKSIYNKHIKSCIQYSKNIIISLKYYYKAINDFRINKMGKLNR